MNGVIGASLQALLLQALLHHLREASGMRQGAVKGVSMAQAASMNLVQWPTDTVTVAASRCAMGRQSAGM